MTEGMGATPAGWYDDGSGRQRYWDGQAWTEHYADEYAQKFGGMEGQAMQGANSADAGAVWSAVGQPLSGIGAGRYRLTEEFLFFEKGALSTRAQQIATHEIHDVDAMQSMTQKARGVGTIKLFAVRSGGTREQVLLEDVRDFRGGVEAINRVSLEARNRLRTKENTQHVNYSGQLPTMQAAPSSSTPAAQVSAGDDAIGRLQKLAELHAAGVLTDEEFSAAKQKALGL
ncbi:DUF2510 domain-containing protein [Demequina sp. NBRC 110054]|uniref:DUF2510 domain-containing protein n=1 Tax=Demequina sp. NBRC 110054 TaxID=1570343 RepID=UPI001F4307EF|nr:DUF2510 domain-containing protein [Demequina sp. NBRC 110054]